MPVARAGGKDVPGCSNWQQAEQESSLTLGTSILGAPPALGKPVVALVAAARLHGTVGPCKSLGEGFSRREERIYDFFFFAATGACTQVGTGASGPTPPPPGFTTQPARQAQPARPAHSGTPHNAATALPELELGAGAPPEQSPLHPRDLAAGDGPVPAGLGPPGWHRSIPVLSCTPSQGFAENGIVRCPAAVLERRRRAHGALIAPVGRPVVMLSTWRSSPCSQLLGVMISVNYFSGSALVAQVSA